MKAADLPFLHTVSRPTLSPDGSRVVFGVTRADTGADAYVGQLWEAATNGETPPRRLTRGFRDTAPQYSPDGTLIAFLRAPVSGRSQLYVVVASGGEPLQVTDEILGIGEFAWSPDSTRLAFTARVPEHGRYGTIDEIGADAEAPRRITTQRYSANGLGYTNDRRSSVFVVRVPDPFGEPHVEPIPALPDQDSLAGEARSDPEDARSDAEEAAAGPGARPGRAAGVPLPTRLTTDDADYSGVQFRPNGASVLAVSARHETRDTDLRTGVYEIPLEPGEGLPGSGQHSADQHGADIRAVVAPSRDLSISAVVPRPDGSLLLLAQEVGPGGRDFVARNTALYIAHDGAAPHRLTDPETVDLGEPGGAITLEGDAHALVGNRTRGTVQLLRVGTGAGVDGSGSGSGSGSVAVVVDGAVEVTGSAAASGVVAVALAHGSSPGEIAVVRDGTLTPITDFAAPLRTAGIAAMRDVVIPGRDGYPVHGWVLTPEGEGPHPVLLSIHGGPFAAYSVSFFDEAQVYVDAGYAVVLCNPRGSAGYGQAHGRAIRQRMGTVDLHDVLDFLDGVIAADPRLDGTRVGIQGGSYGGYLTAWTIAHEQRFAAAIVERGFLDPDAFVGTSDIGSFFGDEYVGTDPERMRAQSPQAVVGAVRTPTLVLHSAQDLRCPLGQAERYYAALKRGGVAAELLIFPGENHELSRSGRPRHRVQRFDAILEWWARYLPTERNAAGSSGDNS